MKEPPAGPEITEGEQKMKTGCRSSAKRTVSGLRRVLVVLLALMLLAQLGPVAAFAEDEAGESVTASIHRHTDSCYETDPDTGERVLTCTLPETAADEGEIGDYTFKLGTRKVTPKETEEGWYVEIPNIYARNLNYAYTVTATGPEGKIFSIRYSALSYARFVLEQNEDEVLAELVRAMVLYNRAACQYFDSLEG